jgi:(p)ppGpp synthase/HD superfamily hydrolase
MTASFDTNMVLRAISFAARAHQGQLRKDRVTPYFAHPLRVMTVLATVFQVDDPELLATAALHDTIEDTNTDRDELDRQFGGRVAQYVALLSKDKRQLEEEREARYYAGLAKAPVGVKLCKLADVYDNLIDSLGLSPDARKKTVCKGRELVRMFRDDLEEQWQHVLHSVEQQIERAVAMESRIGEK